MTSRHDSEIRLGLELSLIRVGQLVCGTLIQIYTVTALGAGHETDALFAGMTLPQIFMGLVGGALFYALIPFFSIDNDEAVRRDGWTLLQLTSATSLIITVVLEITTAFWIPLTVPGFRAGTLTLAIRLARIQLLGLTGTGSTYVLLAMAHGRQRFRLAALSTFAAAGLSLALLWLGLQRFGISMAAWTQVFLAFCPTIFLVPLLGAWSPVNFQSKALTQLWPTVRPILFGSSYYKTDVLVDRFLASYLPAGQLAIFSLAQRLTNGAAQILTQGIAVTMYPSMSRAAAAGRLSQCLTLCKSRLHWMTRASAAVTILIAISRPAMRFILLRGNFSARDVNALWMVCLCFSGFIAGSGWGEILSKAFYSCGDTVTPTFVGVVGFTLGILFKVGGFSALGINGIAIGWSAYFLFNALAMYYLLNRNLVNRRALAEQADIASVPDAA